MRKFKNHRVSVSDNETLPYFSAAITKKRRSVSPTYSPRPPLNCDSRETYSPKWQMQPTIDRYVYISKFLNCRNAFQTREVHAQMVVSGLINTYVIFPNKLLYLYVEYNDLNYACKLFERMSERDSYSWNVMIGGFAKIGDHMTCFETFRECIRSGERPDHYGFPNLLRACSDTKNLQMGRLVHQAVYKFGLHFGQFVVSALIDMYAKCRVLVDARKLFDRMMKKDLVTWTVMIGACVEHGDPNEALVLFDRMMEEDVKPDKITIVTVVSACAKLGAMHRAQLIHKLLNCGNVFQIGEVHAQIVVSGLFNTYFSNKLLYKYVEYNDLNHAHRVFERMSERDLYSWNVMIAGFAKIGDYVTCFETFRECIRSGEHPDNYTLPSVIRACSDTKNLKMGRLVHQAVYRFGLHFDQFVADALIDMYARCMVLVDARKLFDRITKKDLVTWTVMIGACVEHGNPNEALVLFDRMVEEDVTPDNVTMVTVVNACAKLGVMHRAKLIHDYISKKNFSLGVLLGTAMIDMYAKCGSVDSAREIFDSMNEKNIVAWSAIIAAYGYHGQGQKALDMLPMMLSNGISPNRVTFVSLLYACSHAGLIEEGLRLFSLMKEEYYLEPDVKHYTCMVDLLGRAGRLDQATKIMVTMTTEKDEGLWGALLAACRIHGHTELAEKAAQSLLELQPQNPESYVLLSDIYAKAGRRDSVDKIRELMTQRTLKKVPGWTWIEVENNVYKFSTGDHTHPKSKEIYEKLLNLIKELKLNGYVPDTDNVLDDVNEELELDSLFTQSEIDNCTWPY